MCYLQKGVHKGLRIKENDIGHRQEVISYWLKKSGSSHISHKRILYIVRIWQPTIERIPAVKMKVARYKKLQRNIILIILFVSFTPLCILGGVMYYQVARMYGSNIEEQIRYRANSQAEAVDLFLKERTAILASIADTHKFQDIIQESNLLRVFEIMNSRAGAFVDLGVIDSDGNHRAYIGPYPLKGLNYFQQAWFSEVMSKRVYLSDVYTGFRAVPHFIIAVGRQEDERSWILRATIDPEIFGEIVRSAQIGKTGDAFIVNKEGVYQTNPRFNAKILAQSDIDPQLFGGRVTIYEGQNGHGGKRLYAGKWLKEKPWLLVISQEVSEEMGGLMETRKHEIFIIVFGTLAIILTTVFTTRLIVLRLKKADDKMNELSAQLLQADKMAALGKMAAGVAHEINNPLAVILQKTGWMEDLLLEEDFQNSKELQEYRISIKKIEEHVERARKVVHSMLGFARRMEPRLEDVDVNDAVKQTVALLNNYARINNIEIQTDLQSDLPIIASDQSQIQQVLMNIISNAIDAIGKDGLIKVETRLSDSLISIKISDNGPGIPESVQKRIFDPFFTTKETGKGTGLGLWITYNIIEKLGGSISLQSQEGEGSSFMINLKNIRPEKK